MGQYPQAAVHRTILVVDVEGFGDRRRSTPHRVAVREGLYRLLRQAFDAAGIAWADCWHQDCGDGVFILAPAEVPKGPFVEVLPHELAEVLHEHNEAHRAEERIRLRMALHAGEVVYDEHGVTAASINLTFRLLEAPALKAALASSPGVLTLIASVWFFDEVVRHSPVIDSATYRPVRVAVKETTTLGWICRPDHPYPADQTISGPAALSGQPGSVLQDTLAETADQLAQAVGTRWQREEEQRQIQDPFPLPVRWRLAPEDLTDHWANICRAPAGDTPCPLALSGQLDEVVDVYWRIPSGRLVVLGRAGSGKTVLTLRFVLDLLKTRSRTDAVPVIFSLGSWNPAAISLRDWLTVQLVRDYPGLAATGPSGSTLAAALVEAGRVLPVLDGFDEIADGLHRAALQALNATTLPLLLTSRPTEYATAVAGTDVLTSAAGIELTDLTPTDLVNYLPRTTRKTISDDTATVWDPVLNQLRAHPQSLASVNLAAVLTTPLMVALARTIYSDTPDHSPSVLLDTNQFGTSDALEDHLLDNFIPTVYRHQLGNPPVGSHRHWDAERVRHWLGYIAQHLDHLGTRDLAWWQLGATMRRSSRLLLVGLLAGLVNGLVSGLGAGLMYGLMDGLEVVLVAGLAVGPAFGLLHGLGLVFESALFEPSRVQIQIRGGTTKMGKRFVLRLAGGLAAGLAAGLMARFEAPIDIRSVASPSDLLNANRTTVVFQSLVWGPVFGLGVGLVGGLVGTPATGLQFGLVLGLGLGLGYGLSLTAWGQWVTLSRIWLPLTGQLPWAVTAFLDDAYQRGVLRQAGAVYQFRHARLQDHLTQAFRAHRDQRHASSR